MHLNLIEEELSIKTGGEKCMYSKEINTEGRRNDAWMRSETYKRSEKVYETGKVAKYVFFLSKRGWTV